MDSVAYRTATVPSSPPISLLLEPPPASCLLALHRSRRMAWSVVSKCTCSRGGRDLVPGHTTQELESAVPHQRGAIKSMFLVFQGSSRMCFVTRTRCSVTRLDDVPNSWAVAAIRHRRISHPNRCLQESKLHPNTASTSFYVQKPRWGGEVRWIDV